MFNLILEWIADRSLLIAGIALAIAIILRFEKKLKNPWKRRLIVADIGFAVAVYFLGCLKDHLDAKWKREVNAQVAQAQRALDSAVAKMSRMGPRHISQEQRDIILRQLSSAQIKKPIAILVDGSDGEATQYASELLRALVQCGLTVTGDTGTFAFVIPPGRVNIVSNTGELDREAAAVMRCLNIAAVPSSVFVLPKWPGVDSEIALFVGKRIPEETSDVAEQQDRPNRSPLRDSR